MINKKFHFFEIADIYFIVCNITYNFSVIEKYITLKYLFLNENFEIKYKIFYILIRFLKSLSFAILNN